MSASAPEPAHPAPMPDPAALPAGPRQCQRCVHYSPYHALDAEIGCTLCGCPSTWLDVMMAARSTANPARRRL